MWSIYLSFSLRFSNQKTTRCVTNFSRYFRLFVASSPGEKIITCTNGPYIFVFHVVLVSDVPHFLFEIAMDMKTSRGGNGKNNKYMSLHEVTCSNLVDAKRPKPWGHLEDSPGYN